MFPINWNFPFRKSDGSMSTIGEEISEGGGGGGYTLPTASTTTKGGVKIGVGLTMDGEVLKNTNPNAYTLPTADAEVLGGIKVGTGLSIDENGVLSASGGGGGTACHLFILNTSNTDIKELAVYTTVDTITNLNTLLSALKSGVGIVLQSKDSVNTIATSVTASSNNMLNIRKCTLTIADNAISTTWSTSSMGSGGITVSNITKIY